MSKTGFLWKEGGIRHSWRKRFFKLENGIILYKKGENDVKETGTFDLEPTSVCEPCTYKGKPNCFKIVTTSRTWYMYSEDLKESEAWVSAIQTAIEQLKKGGNAETKQKKISKDDFNFLKLIGKGSFGKVVQVVKIDTGKVYAMKILNKKTILERNELEHTRAEKNILQKLVHPFLVNLHFSFQDATKLYFVMDFVNGGELFYHLQNNEKFDESRTRFYCAEIVLGLEYLHGQGVLYRDLKPENILLSAEGHICLTDFGISKEGLLAEDDRTATFCGTPEYLAPEILTGAGYGLAVDWWSFGTLMFEMLTGLPPFYSTDVQKMYGKIMNEPLKFTANISDEARSLVTQLLDRDPKTRLCHPPTIKQHAFFAGIDWDKLLAMEITPPFVPTVKDKLDTSYVDPAFLNEPLGNDPRDDPISSAGNKNFESFTYVAPDSQ